MVVILSSTKEKMIEKIKLPIPRQINFDVIQYLGHHNFWNFVFDHDRETAPPFSQIMDSGPTTDSGFATITYSINNHMKGTRPDEYLNNFGNWVYNFCRENSKVYNIIRLERLYWNLYSRTSKCKLHDDMSARNFTSIIYNFLDNDGGTQIQEHGFFPAKEREAVLFPSTLLHKGVGPTKNKWRLSLNLIVKTE